MRRRLIQSTLSVVLFVIAVFGISLVIVETRTISSSAQERVDSEALRLASIVDGRLLGDDGGACVTFNGAGAWSTQLKQPTAQF